VEMVVMKDCHE